VDWTRGNSLQGESNKGVRVLDLGSGKGGSARWLAKTYGCHVTCFNLGKKQNEFNKAKAVQDGFGDLIDTHLGSFNEPLPMDWTDSFDMVWSQEAFCHCMDHKVLIAEIQRVLKPGGTIVFSDIMQGDNGGDCSSFTGQNVTTKLATPQMYKVCLQPPWMRPARVFGCRLASRMEPLCAFIVSCSGRIACSIQRPGQHGE
jgi:cyclopropane fatty-acyl-phospholipid synthase-like methyltransferase